MRLLKMIAKLLIVVGLFLMLETTVLVSRFCPPILNIVVLFGPKYTDQGNGKSKAEFEKNFKAFFCNWHVRLGRYRRFIIDALLPAEIGKPAPNAMLVNLDGAKSNILDFVKKGRPLVVNFGSCSWPPFMKKQEHFKQVVHRFSSSADFLVVYVEETHPVNHRVSIVRKIEQHRTVTDRIAAAKILSEMEYPCEVVVDNMANEALWKYGARPDKLAIILDGILVYLGKRGPWGYHVEEVEEWLERFTGSEPNRN